MLYHRQFIVRFGITTAVVVGLAALTPGCADAESPRRATGGAATAPTQSTDQANAETVTLEYDVKGMSCQGCVFSVRSAIAELDGVESCDVSLEEERALVTARSASVSPQIIEAVEELDFTITPAGRGVPRDQSSTSSDG